MITLLKIFLVAVILVCMVMILMGIAYLSKPGHHHEEEDAAELRREIKDKEDVMGRYSAFRQFLGQSRRKL